MDRRELHKYLAAVWVVVLLSVVLTTTQCARPYRVVPRPSTVAPVDFRGDFESSDTGQYNAVECPHPERQLKIVTDPVRQGRYAARFEVAPGDRWTNGSVRCLVANTETNEREGDDYYFAFSIYFPGKPSNNLIWELHSREEIYSVDPDLGVSPHAILSEESGRLNYRLLSGPALWSGSEWTGWQYAEPSLPLLEKIQIRRWIDIVIHINFAHRSEGMLEVWCRTEGERWSEKPQVSRTGVPTLQWIPGHEKVVNGGRNDVRIQSDIYTSSLYVELGLYPGTKSIARTDVLYLDGYRRGTSPRSVLADFP